MKQRPFNGWINYRYLEQNGINKRKAQFPIRERFLLKVAVDRLKIPYRQMVPFYNPLYNGWKDETEGAIQWADFVLFKERIFVVRFTHKYRSGGAMKYKKKSYEAMKQYLTERNIPMLTVDRHHSSQEYELLIRRFMRQMKPKHETITPNSNPAKPDP